MKNYDERIESIFRKYDDRLVEKKRRKAMILRSFVIGVGAAAVIGVGLTTYALRPPKKPTPSRSGIIVETETTSAETTVAPASPSTTVPKTTATKQVTTTAVSTAATTSSARQTAATVHTTSVAARTTRTAVSLTTVSSPETTSFSNTTYVTDTIADTTTTVSEYTTTTENRLSGGESPFGSKSEYDKMLEDNFSILELMNGSPYTLDCYYAEDAQVGEYLFELELVPTEHTNRLPSSICAKVYEFKNSVQEYQLIVKFEGSKKNYPYVNFEHQRQIVNNTEKE